MGLVVLSLTIHSLLEMILLPPNLEPTIISKETRKYVNHLIFQLHGERVIDHSISMAYLKKYLFQLPSEESRLRHCSGKDKYVRHETEKFGIYQNTSEQETYQRSHHRYDDQFLSELMLETIGNSPH